MKFHKMLLWLLLLWKIPFYVCIYESRIILDNYRKPNNLVYHKYTDTLFFSHTMKSGDDFEIIAYDMQKNATAVLEVPGGYAIAYDKGNDDIYFGGHDGIYKYNYMLEQAEFFGEDKKSIWGMCIGTNFYYIQYPKQQLYVYRDDKFVPVAEAIGIEVDNFLVSKRSDIYYSNKTATFKVDAKTRDTVILSDEVKVRQIADDNNGDVYFCGTGGIYTEYKPNYNFNKIVDIEDVFGLTFDDNNNIIYSDDKAIYRLVPIT
ncbi:ommochrome-binding protein-like [Aricia agestis]|uniref:ommochrome-binding protein-like n=1 Tax=Aricia agestis TaxID=91739 RepID=UPI001C209EC8|nr:ommochrome-binding protein-like [Aricia agestis]